MSDSDDDDMVALESVSLRECIEIGARPNDRPYWDDWLLLLSMLPVAEQQLFAVEISRQLHIYSDEVPRQQACQEMLVDIASFIQQWLANTLRLLLIRYHKIHHLFEDPILFAQLCRGKVDLFVVFFSPIMSRDYNDYGITDTICDDPINVAMLRHSFDPDASYRRHSISRHPEAIKIFLDCYLSYFGNCRNAKLLDWYGSGFDESDMEIIINHCCDRGYWMTAEILNSAATVSEYYRWCQARYIIRGKITMIFQDLHLVFRQGFQIFLDHWLRDIPYIEEDNWEICVCDW